MEAVVPYSSDGDVSRWADGLVLFIGDMDVSRGCCDVEE